jgi:hypothetical protein
MTTSGTKRTSRDVCCLSAFGAKRTMHGRVASTSSVAHDPNRTLSGLKSRSAAVPCVVFLLLRSTEDIGQ